MFPSVACSSYFGYFVQFSRCVWSFVETRFKHSANQMLESKFNLMANFLSENCWWAQVDSNHRPHDYQSCALAS